MTGRAGPDWPALAEGMAGELLRPGEQAYERRRGLVDPSHDAVRPAAIADCRGPGDVAEVLGFARRFGVGTTVRSGGHSAVGASTLADGIVIDVGSMAGVRQDADLVRVGGGATHHDLYSALAASGRLIPAGVCATVGVSGLTLGGGVGKLTRGYGLTCDQVRSLEIVTADGTVRQVDAASEPDLFWACRGGGGGLAGVVTELGFRAPLAVRLGCFSARWTGGRAAQVAHGWQRWIQSAPEEVTASLELQAHSDGRTSAFVVGVSCANDPQRQLQAIEAAVGRTPVAATAREDWSLGPMYETGRLAEHLVAVQGGDLLAHPLPEPGITALIGVLGEAARRGLPVNVSIDPLTGAAARTTEEGAAWPWRGAFASVFWHGELERASLGEGRAWLSTAHHTLAPWSIGAYVNLLDDLRTDPRTYFGASLARLRRIRARYDPDGLIRLPYRLEGRPLRSRP